ncbi:protein FAR1-RELATED SEQUENCE 4-like [Asparagus officinalis]|uniref:protein FAR1-RELATED SEQUENCE 4-like n=1 Tax=Asparagus officinalis TaxID=4686 RepID=UPI00098E7398|nr:protein FAR1-RELATED SEQUENCE 4-like [Asparagus officinalis]
MKFNSHEEAYNYYNSYALLMGFGIRKSTVNYSRKTREVVDRKFVYDKEGYKPNSGKIEIPLRRETRVGCKAMMRVKLLEDKSWEITGFVEEHTKSYLMINLSYNLQLNICTGGGCIGLFTKSYLMINRYH